MDLKVLLFANLRELAGTRQVEVSLPEGSTVKDLKHRLAEEYPVLQKALDSALISINRQFAFDEDLLPAGAEAAVFPPVSGGAAAIPPTYYEITESELDLNEVLRKITLPTTGAACIFSGTVRESTSRGESHPTSYLVYEAYEPMAEEKMRQVSEEIRLRWPKVEGIYMVQRVGRLEAGTPTILIACSSAHRDEGVFEAARYGIDRLKEIVPIWKKEVGTGGEEWVEGEYIPGRTD